MGTMVDVAKEKGRDCDARESEVRGESAGLACL